MRAFVAVSTLVLSMVGTEAIAATGNEFYNWCQNPNTSVFASAYVSAVVDTTWSTPGVSIGYCAPREVVIKQLTDVACDWLGRNPAQRHRIASGLVNQAFRETWPCN